MFLLVGSVPLRADTLAYITATSLGLIDPGTGAESLQYNTSVNGRTLGNVYRGTVPLNGTLSYDDFAAAERGSLHASSSFVFDCASCNFTGTEGSFAISAWYEVNARALQMGPGDLLSGVTGFQVIWTLDGTLSNYGDPNQYVALLSAVYQGSSTTRSSIFYYGPPSNTSTFFIQPPDPLAPFDFTFSLMTQAATSSCCVPASGNVDFSNTASLVSVQAIDSNRNVIPGVELGLADGTLLGGSGFASTNSPVPEPSTLMLTGTSLSIIVLGFAYKRQVRLRDLAGS